MIDVGGVDAVPFWLPLVVSFSLTTLMAPAGLSGAFLLLPFQVSVLGIAGPAVTATNHLFNVIATPSAIFRYAREKRMLWPLAWVILLGSIPGAALGFLARIHLLTDPRRFKLLVAGVLLLLGASLVHRIRRRARRDMPADGRFEVENLPSHRGWLEFRFEGRVHRVSVPLLAGAALLIGTIGGAYGVGGGAMIAPFLVAVLDLPVHATAGATILGTGVTSLTSVALFAFAGRAAGAAATLHVAPDWRLGLLFGVGGFFGMYAGARAQRHLPARAIESVLAVVVVGLALFYLAAVVWGR